MNWEPRYIADETATIIPTEAACFELVEWEESINQDLLGFENLVGLLTK
jgi:hypothetical protein